MGQVNIKEENGRKTSRFLNIDCMELGDCFSVSAFLRFQFFVVFSKLHLSHHREIFLMVLAFDDDADVPAALKGLQIQATC